ncbi:MAG: SGNH/GDSL hydrolase family protein [Clostridia bacterium]|nr:SGNH/GDSL hydrolase family protein [Clostridia bacterium]
MKLQGKRINVLGDSITFGHWASSDGTNFVSLLAKEHGAICRNYGVCGTRIARQRTPSWNPSFDEDFVTRALTMDPDADVVIVFGGTNDFGHGDAPLGVMSDRRQDTFYGALHVLYRTLLERYPAAAILVLTPLHRTNEADPRGDGNKAEDVGTLHTYVDIIREVAEYYSLPLLDLYASSGLQPCVEIIREHYMPDGLHPNDAGHRVLANKIAAFLQQM